MHEDLHLIYLLLLSMKLNKQKLLINASIHRSFHVDGPHVMFT